MSCKQKNAIPISHCFILLPSTYKFSLDHPAPPHFNAILLLSCLAPAYSVPTSFQHSFNSYSRSYTTSDTDANTYTNTNTINDSHYGTDNVSVTVKMSVMEKLIMTRFFGRKQKMPELVNWMLSQVT